MRQSYSRQPNVPVQEEEGGDGGGGGDQLAAEWEIREADRQYESACLAAMVEQLSKVDRAIMQELIMKKKVLIKVPGGLFCGPKIVDQISNLGKSMEMCKSIKIEIGWAEESSGDKKKEKKDKKEKKERQTRAGNGQFPNGFCSAMLEVMIPEAQANI